MISKTVYGLLKEAYEELQNTLHNADLAGYINHTNTAGRKLYTALKSLESDSNIYKLVK